MIDHNIVANIKAQVYKPPKNTRIAGGVLCRMASSRLPGKAILPLAGKPEWWHCLQRVEAAARVAGVELAGCAVLTSAEPSNDILEAQARQYGYDCIRYSPEDDTVGRQMKAMDYYGTDAIMTASGDAPLFWYEHIAHVIEPWYKYNMVGRCSWRWGDPYHHVGQVVWTLGLGVRWSFEFQNELRRAQQESDQQVPAASYDWAMRPDAFIPPVRDLYTDWPEEMWTYYRPYILEVDWPQDAVLMQIIYDQFYKSGEVIDSRKAIEWVDAHPEYHYNRDRVESQVNQFVHGMSRARMGLEYLDYCEAMAPPGCVKIYCPASGCGEYMGFAKRTHNADHLHRPDGSIIEGNASLCCSRGHTRMWYETERAKA